MFHHSSKQIVLGVFVALSLTMPVYAVKNFKTSNFGNARQIWFEAEDYDERNPDTNAYYPVVDAAGAFGKAITRTGSAGGMIRWTFDISTAGGKRGTWYFWARLINPGNTSDYMLVKGDPGDPTIPTGPPFPGGSGTAPFTDADDRVFEGDFPAPWQWGQGWDPEGHVKELQDGENTMYIFHRQGDSTVFWDVFVWTDSATYVPTDADFQKATTVLPGKALNPSPANEATDVPRDAMLSWTAVQYPVTHDVYFGTTFADVDNATRTNTTGILVSKGQADPTFDPAGVFAYGQTYFWRIDEVNKSADATVYKGLVWSFTTEPYGYPITGVTATASSSAANMGPEKTIDGSGLTGDLHGTDATTMWLSGGAQPSWIQYQFDKVYKLNDLKAWNSNQQIESFLGFGAKKVTIEYSADGSTWKALANVPEFAQAPGVAGYAANTTVNFGGVLAKYVKLTIDSNWGGVAPQAGLSEVRFSYAPVLARAPQPANDAGGVKIDTTLDWRPGREAGSHQVYFGTDRAAVANGTVAAQTAADHGYTPGSLNFGTTYYWRVDEVNTVTYPGDVWSFTTQPYQAVEDFESYNDDDKRIYDTWIDGLTDGKSGSVVGYDKAPFAEQTIIRGGKQSMPLAYDNSKTPFYSEATRTFDAVQNWTANGATTLSVYCRGRAAAFADNGNNTFTMSSSGTDIWNNGDQFRFAYKSLSANGSIVARVDSIVNTNVWAKGGVMIRQSIDPGSTHAFMPITPGGSGAGNGASFQHRLTASGASTNNDNPGAVVAVPYWVKVERTGNSFTGSISPDGKTWTPLGTPQTIVMTNPVLIGLAVCSHDAALTTVAEFSNVAITGTVTGSWQAAAIGATMATNDPAPLYLTVTDKAGKTKTVVNPNPSASATAAWTEWQVPLSSLTGVSLTTVQKITLGVGDKASPKAGGAGMLYIDDVQFGKPVQRVALPGEILIEPESATSITAPMAIVGDPLASGGKYIGTPTTQADSSTNPPSTGIAKIPFTVTGGKYKLLFWVFIPTDNDSLWVRIADATTQTKNHASGWVRFNNIPRGEYWHLVTVHSNDDGDQVVEWTLAAGAHTLEIAYREAGAQVDTVVIQPLN